MKSLLALIITFFVSAPAFAYFIEGLSYDSGEMTVYVDLVFEGGKKEHVFTPQFDPCFFNENPNGLAVRLVDTGWDDTGKDLIRMRVPIDLKGHLHCLPAHVSVYVGAEFDMIYAD